MSEPAAVEGDFTERQSYPFMVGLYLAVNAIADAYLLVDGPDCAHMKTQYIQGNHDWLSTLTDISGLHRVSNTALHPFHMAGSREDELVDKLTRIASFKDAGVVLVSPMPMAAITGVDYDRLARIVDEKASQCPVAHIPGRSLSGDWLSGYGLALSTIAKTMDLSEARPHPERVALVGYLMDRNEGDHQANLRDLATLLSGLGLELCSTWLSGGPYDDLKNVREAGLIISLPYGRRASRILSKRLDVPLLETALPFGLDGTTQWVRAVASATNRNDRGEEVIDAGLLRATPPLQWVVPAVFLHRTVSFIGDPHLLEGFLSLTAELGCRHGPMVVTAGAGHSPALDRQQNELSIVFQPTRTKLMEHLEPLRRNSVDLIVTNSSGCSLIGGSTPVLEFGFPSYFTHALYQRPFLGFDGALAFIDSMANALRTIDLLRLARDREQPPTIDKDRSHHIR